MTPKSHGFNSFGNQALITIKQLISCHVLCTYNDYTFAGYYAPRFNVHVCMYIDQGRRDGGGGGAEGATALPLSTVEGQCPLTFSNAQLPK